MAIDDAPDSLGDLVEITASDRKLLGWRGLMKKVAHQGRVLFTCRRELEVVMLTVDEYKTLVKASHAADRMNASALELLRKQFDERLSALKSPDAGHRLREVSNTVTKLGGMVKAGTSF